MAKAKRPFKILCIDGGGIKGLYSAHLLSLFEKENKTLFADQFDLICGTSTGGIIALAASAGIAMTEVVSFYENEGPKIFSQKRKYIPCVFDVLRGIYQALIGPKYDNKILKKALENAFGNRKIGESKTLLCIPTYNVTSGKPCVFKKDYGKFSRDDDTLYVDVALATSAAPTYFPAHKIRNQLYVDGGLWANNPTISAITEYFYMIDGYSQFDGVEILSISSCEKPNGESPRLKRGFFGWRNTLFDDYSYGQSFSVDFLLKLLSKKSHLGICYERISNKLISKDQESLVALDNASPKSLELLKGIAEQTSMNIM